MVKKKISLLLCLGLLSCAPRVAIKSGYDFSRIKTILVEVKSTGQTIDVNKIVANEFIRQLIQSGYSVRLYRSDEELPPDSAILSATVMEFQPNRRYLIYEPGVSSTTLLATPTTLELGGNNVYTFNVAGLSGLENSRVVISNATIGISANLLDGVSGEVVWSNYYSYDGLDIGAALSGAVGYLVRSIPKQKMVKK